MEIAMLEKLIHLVDTGNKHQVAPTSENYFFILCVVY